VDPCEKLRTVDLLVLDDVGADNGSDFTRRELVTLYNARLATGRRTIWTSNLDLDRLAEFYRDDRLTSRIAGAAQIVLLESDDYRARGPKEVR
jgi:DNA replication protein DnaC